MQRPPKFPGAAVHALVVSALVALPAPAQSMFTERAAAVGLSHEIVTGMDRVGWLPSMLDWLQTGAALGDLDGDGDPDLVVAGRFGGTKLFRNQGGSFLDVTATSGLDATSLANCLALGDIDRDGDLDLFLGSGGALEGPVTALDRLYLNDGRALFSESLGRIDTRGGGHTMAAKFVDTDQDGDLDLYLSQFNGTPNQLHVNLGDGTFVERAAELGVDIGGSTHATGFVDVDGDGDLDLIAGNDWMVTAAASMASNENDMLLVNDGAGAFTDVSYLSGVEIWGLYGATTMGLTFGDVDYDGDPDMYRSEYGPQLLNINHGWPLGPAWTSEAAAWNVEVTLIGTEQDPSFLKPTVGWGTRFLHADNDLWLDLYEVTGHISISDHRDQRNFLHRGQGPGGTFVDESAAFGLLEWVDDRGLCVGDPDQDGDLDLVVLTAAGPLRYLENDASSSADGWLQVVVEPRTSAAGGTGTRVAFTDSAGHPHVQWLGADGATASDHERLAHFGLGQETAVDVTVTFPSGLTRTVPGVPPKQRITVVEPELLRLSATRLPAASTGGQQTLVVRAFAHDQTGAPLGPGATVDIAAPGLTPLGPVSHVTGNMFERRFAPAAQPTEVRVRATFDGWSPRIEPTVAFHGDVSPSRTSVLLTPDAVRAGSADTFTVVVTPRDVRGVVLGPGLKVATGLPGAGGIAPTFLTDQGDGTYRVELPAPAQAGLLRLRFGVQTPKGWTLLSTKGLLDSATGPAASADFYQEKPNPGVAASPLLHKLTMLPKDAAGRRIGPGASLSVTLQPGFGSKPVQERTDLRRVTPEGKVYIVLERLAGTPDFSGQGELVLSVDGVALPGVSYVF